MPPRAKYTREEITEIALGIVAESGVESLNARSLAEAMGTSTRPIFTAFRNMEELESAVRESAMKVFGQFAEKENARYACIQAGRHTDDHFCKGKAEAVQTSFYEGTGSYFQFRGNVLVYARRYG